MDFSKLFGIGLKKSLPRRKKRKHTRMMRYVCPWKGTRYYRKLPEDIPPKIIAGQINDGFFDQPGYKWWKDELIKYGKMTKDLKPIYQKKRCQ